MTHRSELKTSKRYSEGVSGSGWKCCDGKIGPNQGSPGAWVLFYGLEYRWLRISSSESPRISDKIEESQTSQSERSTIQETISADVLDWFFLRNKACTNCGHFWSIVDWQPGSFMVIRLTLTPNWPQGSTKQVLACFVPMV